MPSSGRDPRALSNGRPQRAALSVRVKAAPIDRTLILNDKLWTGRLRIDRVMIFQASGSRVFSAVALIGLAVEGLAAIASVAGAVDSGAGAEN